MTLENRPAGVKALKRVLISCFLNYKYLFRHGTIETLRASLWELGLVGNAPHGNVFGYWIFLAQL